MTGPVAQTLLDARELVAGGWCQKAFARDADGVGRSVRDESACMFCAWGALKKLGDYRLGLRARCYFCEAIGDKEVVLWNDNPNRTQLEVVEAFERAALLAMEAGE